MHDEPLTIDSISERQREVLRIVIQEFVQTAQPVGSAGIVGRYDLGVSPATIRNDLAALERMGLLTHPHTSAGRVPTDLGYRFFVHYLLASLDLTPEEQTAIRRQFHTPCRKLTSGCAPARPSWPGRHRAPPSPLRRAPSAAPSSTWNWCIFRGQRCCWCWCLQEGGVKQQLLDVDQPIEQNELSRVSNELNDQLVGLDSGSVAVVATRLTPFAAQVAGLAAETMRRMEQYAGGVVFRDGLAEVLSAPEFAEGENARRIVRVLEEPALIEQIAAGLPGDAVHVVIAGDGRYDELRDVSLVLSRYGVGDRVSGLLGVIGPVRMRYGRTIGAVRFVSDLVSVAAEFQNSRRRQERQLAEEMERVGAHIIKRLLPAMDDFDLAFANVPEGVEAQAAWVEGFRQIQRKLRTAVEEEGLTPIATDGEFDPTLHEAIASAPSDTVASGHVIDTLRAGYTLKGRVLRPALVRVAL
jgi:heat-inducible transcriptional repressor